MSHHLTSLQPALEQTPATPSFSILTSSHHNTTTSAAFASPDQTTSLNLHHILTHFHYSPIHRRRNWRNCCYYHAFPEDFSSGLKASRPTYNTYIHTAYCILLQKWVILHCSYIDTPPLSQTRNYLLCLWILLLLHKTLCHISNGSRRRRGACCACREKVMIEKKPKRCSCEHWTHTSHRPRPSKWESWIF